MESSRFRPKKGFDASHINIINVGAPEAETDAVNKSFASNASNLITGILPVERLPTFSGDIIKDEGTNVIHIKEILSTTATVGSSRKIPRFTYNKKGLITEITEVTIQPNFSDLQNVPTTLSGYGITDGISSSEKGSTIPTLVNGTIPKNFLPSDFFNTLSFATLADFPTIGETDKVYYDLSTGKSYHWTGTVYSFIPTGTVDTVNGQIGDIVISKESLGLGNVDNTADNVKIVAKASRLTNPRLINGVSFDGSADIDIPFSSLLNKPTTLSGYGITNAVSTTANLLPFAEGTISSASLTLSPISVNEPILLIDKSEFRSVKLLIQASTLSSFQISELLLIHNGTNAFITEYGLVKTASLLASFTTIISNSNIVLLATTTAPSIKFSIVQTQIIG